MASNCFGIPSDGGRIPCPSYPQHVAQDTSRSAQICQDDVFCAMTPAQRIAMVVEMSEAMFRIAEDGIRLRHPGYTADEVRLTGIRLRIGDELFASAFPEAAVLGS